MAQAYLNIEIRNETGGTFYVNQRVALPDDVPDGQELQIRKILFQKRRRFESREADVTLEPIESRPPAREPA
jgi:hypothetical protein